MISYKYDEKIYEIENSNKEYLSTIEKLNKEIVNLKKNLKSVMGFSPDTNIDEETLNLFKEIELEEATQDIKNDSYVKILIRNRGNFLSILKKDITKSYIKNRFTELKYDNYNKLISFSEFMFLYKEIGVETPINLYNKLILESEKMLYKYDLFKDNHYKEIETDIELIKKVQEAKSYELSLFNRLREQEMSRHIPKKIKDDVWNRDGGKCVECGSNHKLEFDHIVPFSKGGSNTYRNIQLLCESCNRKKSDKIGY